MSKGAHHKGSHQRRARAIVNAADADPSTRCWRCRRTKAQHRRRWQAGHVIDGQIEGELRAECEECNAREGGKLGAARKGARSLPVTRDW